MNQIFDKLDIFIEGDDNLLFLQEFVVKAAATGLFGITDETVLDSYEDKARDPTNWKVVTIEEVAEFTNGYAFKSSEYREEGVGIIRMSDLKNSEISVQKMKYVSQSFLLDLSPSFQVKPNDLVIGMSGSIGRPCFNRTDQTFLLNQRVGKISPNLKLITPEFLAISLASMEQHFLQISMGSAIKNLSTSQIKQTKIILPPLAIQKIIVAKYQQFSSLAESLRISATTKKSLASKFRKSAIGAVSTAQTPEELQIAWDRIQLNWEVMTETADSVSDLRRLIETLGIRGQLTEKMNLGDTAEDLLRDLGLNGGVFTTDEIDTVPMNWAFTNLGAIIQLDYGKSLPKQIRSTQGKIPVYGSNGIVGYHDEALIENGSIVVGRKGSIGQVNIARGESWIIDTAYYVVPKAGMPIEYLALLIKTSNLQTLNKATAIPGLNRNDAYSQRCFLAPPEEQIRIVQTVNALLEVCDRLAEALQERENIALKFAQSVVSESA
jgi:restriction endonuclease S subunit